MKVNFHTHTILSDGTQTPEALAATLAGAGVRYAALTDHDTVEGLTRFAAALDRHGTPALAGLELTTWHEGREVHLLAYGFDPDHPPLVATLASIRQSRSLDVRAVAGSLRKAGGRRPPDGQATATGSLAPDGKLDVADAIPLLHAAGGRAFLAHPRVYGPEPERIEALVLALKAMGLDGIEAIYAQFSPADRAALGELAERHGLLVSAGTDYHGPTDLADQPPSIDMPRDAWTRFRAAILAGPAFEAPATGTPGREALPLPPSAPAGAPAHRFRPRSFVLRVVLPALAALAVFLAGLWGLILPSFEQTLVERKRELIRELTNSAWSVLAAYEADERSGELTREAAQDAAADLVRELRYGPDAKDYFWIQDTEPRMVMHPYRPDLDGQPLGGYRDPRGVPIFVEFVDLVERRGEGYVDYVWQWQDDPDRLEPKESFVREFAPWGWIIGTGLYTDDVRREIGRLEQDLVVAAMGISGAFAVLLLFVLQQSLRIERRRQEVVEGLRESTERYHALVEATTEGTLLVIDGRCRYANPTFLELVGYSPRQLEFLELPDLLPPGRGNDRLREALEAGDPESAVWGEAHEGCLARADGTLVECILALDPIVFEGQAGHILLARDVTRAPVPGSGAATDVDAPAVVFHAVAARRGVFTELNRAGRDLVGQLRPADATQPALADLFTDPAEYDRVLARLLETGAVRDHVVRVELAGGGRSLSLSATLVRDEDGEPAAIAGLLVDVTAARLAAASREDQVERLQSSLLFLHAPIGGMVQPPVLVALDTPIGDVARRMTERRATAALVASGAGAVIGIVTDLDLRSRAMAELRTLTDPVHSVMSAPVLRIGDGALVYEALMRMEEAGVRHLAVEDRHGTVTGMLEHASLIQFPRYGPLVLLRELGRATAPDEVARTCARSAALAGGLLDSTTRPHHVTTMLTSVLDAATERLVDLAIEELGPPPAAFAWFAMGSQGRSEVTLLTDQDSGIVHAVPDGSDPLETARYFRLLGARVAEGLAGAGYPACRGGVMASEPAWCRPLPAWLDTVDAWVRRGEPQDIADLSVLLDLRLVHGDIALVAAIREGLQAVLPRAPLVLYQLARDALAARPPVRLPGNIYLGGAAESGGQLDLKDAAMPIVAYARVEAARHGLAETNTHRRLDALADRGLLPLASVDEIVAAYDFLVQLRLATQLASLRDGRTPTSSVQLGRLGHAQQASLRQAFDLIAVLQKRVAHEFPDAG